MNVPRNVLWFEALLYMSLTLDAVSVAFQDRTPKADMTAQMINVATVMAAGLILLLVYFVWLAAQRRKNWPRCVLAAALVLSVISLVQVIGAERRAVRQRHRGGLLCADGGGACIPPSPATRSVGSTRDRRGCVRVRQRRALRRAHASRRDTVC